MPQEPLSIPSFSAPSDFQSFLLLPPPPLVCLLNRMGRLGNLEAILKVVTNKSVRIEMTSYEQVSQGNRLQSFLSLLVNLKEPSTSQCGQNQI